MTNKQDIQPSDRAEFIRENAPALFKELELKLLRQRERIAYLEKSRCGMRQHMKNLKMLLDNSLAFVAIMTCEHANSNPGGRLNADTMVMQIMEAIGHKPRHILSENERKKLTKLAGLEDVEVDE